MVIRKKELEKRIEHFTNECRNAGIKLTHQRIEIFREVAQATDHPDAEKIQMRVRKRLPTVSLDTVYRTLWLANDLGLITSLGPSRERTRFDANLNNHHHFICVKCGLTSDFYSDELVELKLPESIKYIGLPEATQVQVKGVCLKCAAKKKINQK
ncbi:Fur family transcriptional regulator [Thermodesulfobacteriota bacterium]